MAQFPPLVCDRNVATITCSREVITSNHAGAEPESLMQRWFVYLEWERGRKSFPRRCSEQSGFPHFASMAHSCQPYLRIL